MTPTFEWSRFAGNYWVRCCAYFAGVGDAVVYRRQNEWRAGFPDRGIDLPVSSEADGKARCAAYAARAIDRLLGAHD